MISSWSIFVSFVKPSVFDSEIDCKNISISKRYGIYISKTISLVTLILAYLGGQDTKGH